MTETTAAPFVRSDVVAARPAPVVTTGMVGFLRTRLFGSPFNIALTIVCALLIAFVVVPAIQFLLIDAVWSGADRNACLAQNAGHPVGACWPFVQAKFTQFVYGFYPDDQRWRVNLTFLLAAGLLLPLLIPRLPGKAANACLFFIAFPVVAFFLLHGGGLKGFAVNWLADGLSGAASSFREAGARVDTAGSAMSVAFLGRIVAVLGKLLIFAGDVFAVLAWPMAKVHDLTLSFSTPLWADLAITALAVSLALFFWRGGVRNGRPALVKSLLMFVAIAGVIAVMGLANGGLPIVDTRKWGGLLVTLVVSVTGIVASMPVGMALALGRRSTVPLIKIFSVVFIEFWRGVPLITVLFFATYMLPLFLPGNFNIDNLLRVLIGTALFAGAYNAEVIRGGLQAIPRGQGEAAAALGLSQWKTTALIVMPQALRNVIPGLVNSFIALFKDTTLVLIVAIFDLLGQLRASLADPNWATPTTLFTGFAFTGMIYFVFCFGMSRYSLFVERRLNAHRNQ